MATVYNKISTGATKWWCSSALRHALNQRHLPSSQRVPRQKWPQHYPDQELGHASREATAVYLHDDPSLSSITPPA